MSVWDAITGRKNKSTQSAPAPTPTPTEPHHVSSLYDPSTPQGVDAFLGSSSFADPSQLHPLAGLDKDTLDYITLEEGTIATPGTQAGLPSRGFTDDLCYGTGITYLTGLSIGGAWGLQEGLRRSVDQPPKLRLNSVLNSITRRGPFLGNSAGVVAICYNFFNLGFSTLRGGKQDALNTVAAGVLSGMVFKSTRGLRTMMISGGIVGSVAGMWAITKRTIFHATGQDNELKSL
ncbi:mitochondrial import inner membrane translocase subunit tim23 [Rhypophila decipiens]|uniref:Mitochondrial import inner membrane translocase subunit tim23 n=1 Tax=Rhypophila decipiens TaxID=261697 RepID=A0AAN6Y590_9PEZI|nr:mitochondrial import inner membrane translocase subunit tim23 [Rhypophila decipiens]